MNSKASPLRHMMKPYQGPQHTVVAFHLKDGGTSIVGTGPNETGAPREDLIFEIGSITKVFTAILLCVLIEHGKIDPRAPLSEISGTLRGVPHWITPERLVSHTSGLPNIYLPLWKALFQQQPEGPYADFTRADLLSWLRSWHAKDPGTRLRHSYSNLGFGLLGEAMAIRVGKPYSELLAELVLGPLGLRDTGDKISGTQQTRFMQPRFPNGKPASPWRFDALAGAGVLRSSAHDLARFSNAVFRAVAAPETALDRAIVRSIQPVFGLGRRGGSQHVSQCSGWMNTEGDTPNNTVLFANGGTAGSTCALFVCPGKNSAIGITSNNGIAANLWAGAKLSLSNPLSKARDLLLSA